MALGHVDFLASLEDARVIVGVLMGLDATDLARLMAADKRRLDSELTENAWCQLCEICWRSKSVRYRLTPERAQHLASSTGASWRQHFKQAQRDGQRNQLQPEELSELRWAFNFTMQAGGRGRETMQFVEFQAAGPGSSEGILLMRGYPPLPYVLSADGKVLDIANFPPHYVRRLDTWEWEITNDNVTLVSCVDDDVQYSERGFLNFTEEDILEQTGDLISREEVREMLRHRDAIPQHTMLFRLLHHASLLRFRQDDSMRENPSGYQE